jgi:outer membrane protein assembly factor BamB
MPGDRSAARAAGSRPGRRRTSGTAAGVSLSVAAFLGAGLAGCGSSGGPPALTVRCTGHTLPGPDTPEVFENDPLLPPPVTAVSGIPRQSGTDLATTLPDTADPADPALGYKAVGQSWRVEMISGSGAGQPMWSATLSVPGGVPGSEADLNLLAHEGYAIATGGSQGQYISAVSATGRTGPACLVPQFAATDSHTELLPHAGIVILPNPTSQEASNAYGDSYWLDGYSTSTGQRVWSISADTAVAQTGPDFIASNDTVYVWQGKDVQAAAFNARTGQHLWTASFSNADHYPDDNGLLGVIGDTAYVMADNLSSTLVVALNVTNGAVRWKRTLPQASATSDVAITQVGDGQILLGDSDNNREYLITSSTGAAVAVIAVGPDASGQNDQLQVCHPAGQLSIAIPGDGAIHLLSAGSGARRTIAIPPGKDVNVAIADTEAYVLPEQAGAHVYGYDLATGKLLWTVPTPGSSAAHSVLYAFDGGFVLNNLDSRTGVLYR